MHKYHKEMMAMAEAAKTSAMPWRVLEYRWINQLPEKWSTCTESPRFHESNSYNIDYRIKPKEKKKLWLWHLVTRDNPVEIVNSRYGNEYEAFVSADPYYLWHKTNTFIEIEGE